MTILHTTTDPDLLTRLREMPGCCYSWVFVADKLAGVGNRPGKELS